MKPFLESEVFEKTKRKGNLSEEAARVASGMSRTLVSAIGQKASAPAKQGKADAKAKVPRPVSRAFLYTDTCAHMFGRCSLI